MRILPAVLLSLLASLVGACWPGTSGDCFKPVGEVVRSAMGPGLADPPTAQLGACGHWVKLEEDGAYYTAYEPSDDDVWTFSEADLVPAGVAHEVSITMFELREPTVFAIPGVSTDDAFAMIGTRTPDPIVVFTIGDLPDELCALLVRLPNDPTECQNLRSPGAT